MTATDVDPDVSVLREEIGQRDDTIEMLAERLAELELALDDEGWTRLVFGGEVEFSRDGLRKIAQMSRLFYLKNPLVLRAVNVQSFYTWAQGVQISAEDPTVNEVVQRFLDDPGNRRAFTGHRSRMAKDVDLAVEGNLFFALFPNVLTGHVRVRSILPGEIDEIICNPQDRTDPWFYVRRWTETTVDGPTLERKACYPDWRYRPRQRPATVRRLAVMWNAPVYHLRVGGLDGMRFGVPETYAALDWARAYKGFLEDWASLVKALSKFAWRLTTKTNKVATAKTRMTSTLSPASSESNPPPPTGGVFIGDESAKLDAIPKTGATTSAEDGKGLRLMVAAAMNIPDTILSGDLDQGNLATATALDRPTELAFLSRQGMWREVLEDLAGFVVAQHVRAPNGRLAGRVEVDVDGLEQVILEGDADPTVTVTFPPILEHDVAQAVKAITDAATLGGHVAAGTIPERTVAELLLSTLGVDNVDELLDELDANREDAAAAGVTEAFTRALREAREAARGDG